MNEEERIRYRAELQARIAAIEAARDAGRLWHPAALENWQDQLRALEAGRNPLASMLTVGTVAGPLQAVRPTGGLTVPRRRRWSR